MSCKPAVRAIALIAGATVATPALAWWDLGHRALCEVALTQVSAPVRRQIEDLIAQGHDPEGRYRTFGSQCVWADDIKAAQPATEPWHYINAPPGERNIGNVPRPPQGDILTALERYLPLLADPTTAPAQRLEALRFVGHFVGDLHQPLHVAYAEDWGGNKYRLRLAPDMQRLLHEDNRDTTNMHAVWDGYLPLYAIDSAGIGLVELLSSAPADVDAEDGPTAWANESLALLNQPAMRYATETRLESLTEDYLVTHADTAIARLRLGAARLARVLQTAFSNTGHQ